MRGAAAPKPWRRRHVGGLGYVKHDRVTAFILNAFWGGRDLSACYFLPSYTSLEFELGPQAKIRVLRHWVKFRLVLVIATPNLKIENRGSG